MSHSSSTTPDRQSRFSAAVAAYLEAAESGRPPGRDELLARYPDLASELADFLDDHEAVDRLIAPLREAAQAVAPATTIPADSLLPNADSAVTLPPVPVQTFGDYDIIEELGCGGMGVVYKARQRSLHRFVALKMIRAGALASAEDKQRFRQEAETAASLEHPHIVPIHEIGELEGQPYFTMKLLCGPSQGRPPAGAAAYAAGPAAQRQTAQLLVQIAHAVQHAHERGVLHRDLKPANILLDDNGQPLITDFGLARRTPPSPAVSDATLPSGQPLGTPAYMAPEQAAGDKKAITVATDVYGLGGVLYTRLTGRPPFRADAVPELFDQIRDHPPLRPRQLNPAIDHELETICLKCLEKEPSRRYQSAKELAEDLEHWLAGEPIKARPIGRPERVWRWCLRNRWVAVPSAIAALLLVLTAIGLPVYTLSLRQAQQEMTQALQREEIQRGLAEANAAKALEQEVSAQAARKDAEANLESARALVGQFFTELSRSKELKQEGLELLRQNLLQRAVDNCEKFVHREAKGAAFQFERAKAYRLLADLDSNLGRGDAAVDAYQQARLILGGLVVAYPGEPRYEQSLATVCHNLALLHQDRNEIDKARPAYEDSIRLNSHVVGNHPEEPLYRAELARSYAALGTLFDEQHDFAQALTAHKNAIDLQEKLTTLHPTNPDFFNDLAQSYGNLSMSYHDQGDSERSAEFAQKSIRIHELLAHEHPKDVDYQYFLALALTNLAGLYQEAGQAELAVPAARRAVEVARPLADAHREMVTYAILLGESASNVGQFLRSIGKPQESLEWFELAIERLQAVLNKDKRQAKAREGLANAYGERAVALARLGRLTAAEGDLVKALEIDNDKDRLELRYCRAWVRALQGNHAEAAALANALANEKNAAGLTYYDVACTLALCATAVQKDEKVEQRDRQRLHEQYALRALQLLEKANASGFFKQAAAVERLRKAPDLVSVRTLTGYQKLLTELREGNRQ